MRRGERVNLPWVVPIVAILLMLFLLSASGSQPSLGEGNQSSCGACGQQSNMPTENDSILMQQTSGIESAILDLNTFSATQITFNLKKSSSSTQAQKVITANDTAKHILLRANDASNDKLRYEIVSLPKHGAFSGKAPNIVYRPEKGYTGNDSFNFSADDEKGNKQIVTVAIDVVQLYHPPNVIIRSPQNGMIFTEDPGLLAALVTIHATSTGYVSKVTFYDGLTPLDSVDCPPGEADCPVSLDDYPFDIGTHTLIAKATDSYGKTCTSLPVVIIVNPPEPTVKITNPVDGQLFTAPADISIAAEVSGSSPVTQVEFFANSQSLGVVETAPYQLDWTNVMPGVYHLVAKATDENGDVSISKTVFIIVVPANPNAKSNLVITMSSSPTLVRKGGNFNYVLTVTNRGPDSASDVGVTDLLPDEVTYKSSKATLGTYDSSSGVWSLGSLTKYQSARLVITVNVPPNTAPGQITNTADVGGAETDPDDSNNHATTITKIRG